jgi:hypothetical protein
MVAPSEHDVPAGQTSHDPAPSAAEKLPPGQRLHTSLCAAAYEPASHVVGSSDPVRQAVPAGQPAQSVEDVRLVASPCVLDPHSSAALAPSAQ